MNKTKSTVSTAFSNLSSRLYPLTETRHLIISFLLIIIVLSTALRLFALDLPGLNPEETYYPTVALLMQNKEFMGHPHLDWAGYQLPLAIGFYGGSFLVYVYWFLLQFIFHPLLPRFVNIFWSLLTTILLFKLAKDLWASDLIGLIAAGLWAIMPSPVFYSRIGDFNSFVRLPFSVAILFLAYRFVKTAKGIYLYATCFVLGLSLNTRLDMLWWLPALLIWVPLVINTRTAWKHLIQMRLFLILRMSLIAAGAFFIGTLPFAIFVLQDVRHFIALFLERNTTLTDVNNTFIWQNLLIRCQNLLALINGSKIEGLVVFHPNPVNGLVFLGAVLFSLIVVVKGWRVGRRVQSFELLLSSLSMVLVQSTITLSSFKPWHILIVLPLAILLMAFLVRQVIHRHKKVGLLLLTVILISNVVVTVRNYAGLLPWRGTGVFTTAIYDLAKHLEQQGVERVITGDWGFQLQIYFLSKGSVKTKELVVYWPPPPPFPQWFSDGLIQEAKPGAVWVFYHNPQMTGLSMQEPFLGYVRTMNLKYDLITLSDSQGPAIDVYHIHADSENRLLEAKNLLANSSFEETDLKGDVAAWSRNGSPIIDHTGTHSHSGQVAMQVNGQANSYQTVKVEPGQIYTLGHWTRTDAPPHHQGARLQINWLDNSYELVDVTIAVIGIGSTWQWQQISTIAPIEATFAQVYVTVHEDTPTWFDDIALVKGWIYGQESVIMPRDMARLSIVEFNPTVATTGQSFNLQPNGDSTMWFRTQNATPTTILVINGTEKLPTVYDTPELLTVVIPREYYATAAGTYQLYLFDPLTQRKSNTVEFVIAK